jgi:hypothetical protein
MEDSSEQQWIWALAVGAVFALYGVCSLYNWFATILGNHIYLEFSPVVFIILDLKIGPFY